MSKQGNGKPLVYRVSQLGSVKVAIQEQHASALLQSNGSRYLAALSRVYQRLRTDPHGFGEPKYRLPSLHLVVFVGVQHPLVVEFAIHDTELLVVIRSVKSLD